jgi:serine phosphatase RsbU (regulator of sigma subunit)
VRRGDGTVERFDSTTFLLGAVPDADFDADEREFTLAPADVLVLVTDGVHEAADRLSRQFGLDRIRETLERAPNGDRLASHLTQVIAQWSGRVGDDDVLVAALRAPRAVAAIPGAGNLAMDIDAMAGFGATPVSAATPSEAVATAGPTG